MTLFDALPPTVRVGPYDVQLCVEDADWMEREAAHGSWDRRSQTIHLAQPAPSDRHRADTLIHEINHAIWAIYNIRVKDGEERVVTAFSLAWTQVYRDNPWLPPLLADATK